MIKKLGFTLSEVLVALGTIGVVAALVLPQLVTGERASTAKAQFNTAYAMVTKIVTDLDIDDNKINHADFNSETTDNSNYQRIYNKFKNYSRVTVDCGTGQSTNTSVCPNFSHYKTLNKIEFSGLTTIGSYVVNNGMAIAISKLTNNNIFLVFVDINGKDKKPNRLGYDLFGFQITQNGEITPIGSGDSYINNEPENLCCSQLINPGCSSSNDNQNGISCAIYAISDEEYFDKIYKGY